MTDIGTYTTPEITINVPLDLTSANIYVTFRQGGKTIFEKDETEMTVTAEEIVVPLTQEDTGKFSPGPMSFQIKYVFPDGSSDVSNEMRTEIVEAYKRGVTSYVER